MVAVCEDQTTLRDRSFLVKDPVPKPLPLLAVVALALLVGCSSSTTSDGTTTSSTAATTTPTAPATSTTVRPTSSSAPSTTAAAPTTTRPATTSSTATTATTASATTTADDDDPHRSTVARFRADLASASCTPALDCALGATSAANDLAEALGQLPEPNPSVAADVAAFQALLDQGHPSLTGALEDCVARYSDGSGPDEAAATANCGPQLRAVLAWSGRLGAQADTWD
jgi:hypothetical protein